MTSLVSPPLYQAVLCVQQRNSSGRSHLKQLRMYKQQRKTSMSTWIRLRSSSTYYYLCCFLIVSLVVDVDLQLMTFSEFGKDVPKMFKLSPDGFIQMAIQLAYYKYAVQPNFCSL